MNKSGKGWIVLGSLCITAALCLVFLNVRQSRSAEISSEQILNELAPQIPTVSQEVSLSLSEAVIGDETEYPNYLLNPRMDMPVINIDGYDYIGILSIPALELELPIMGEWSYPALQIAPCRYSGSVYTDSLILCAHNFPSHFGRLNELSGGDSVIFQDADGNIFHYRVSGHETLQPTALEAMEEDNYGLTLFTCTVGGLSRVTLRCERDR